MRVLCIGTISWKKLKVLRWACFDPLPAASCHLCCVQLSLSLSLSLVCVYVHFTRKIHICCPLSWSILNICCPRLRNFRLHCVGVRAQTIGLVVGTLGVQGSLSLTTVSLFVLPCTLCMLCCVVSSSYSDVIATLRQLIAKCQKKA